MTNCDVAMLCECIEFCLEPEPASVQRHAVQMTRCLQCQYHTDMSETVCRSELAVQTSVTANIYS